MSAEELKSLEGEAAAADQIAQPVAATGAAQASAGVVEPPVSMEAAERESGALLDMLTAGVSSLWPVLKFSPETVAQAAKKLAPVMVKYNMNNTFFAKWDAEISAGMFFGGVIWKCVQVVRAEKAKAQPEGGSDGGKQ
jgi:hypothetical protein